MFFHRTLLSRVRLIGRRQTLGTLLTFDRQLNFRLNSGVSLARLFDMPMLHISAPQQSKVEEPRGKESVMEEKDMAKQEDLDMEVDIPSAPICQ